MEVKMSDYFKKIKKIRYGDILNQSDKIYAHLSNKDDRIETLEEHADLCIVYFKRLIHVKNLEKVFENMEKILFSKRNPDYIKLFREMLYHTIYLHDIGKINCNYQVNKMKNNYHRKYLSYDSNNSTHSMLSSILYMNEYYPEIKKNVDLSARNQFIALMVMNAYVISRHHGNLISMKDFEDRLLNPDGDGQQLATEQKIIYEDVYIREVFQGNPRACLQSIINRSRKYLKERQKEASIDFYIYVRFLSSLLFSCDYYATTEFKTRKEIMDFGTIEDVWHLFDIYKSNPIYKLD